MKFFIRKLSKIYFLGFIFIISCGGGSSSGGNNNLTDQFRDDDQDGLYYLCDPDDTVPNSLSESTCRSLNPFPPSDNQNGNTNDNGNVNGNINGNGNANGNGNTNGNTNGNSNANDNDGDPINPLDFDGDGIANVCDADPNNALITNINQDCDSDADGLIDNNCREYLGKTGSQKISPAEYERVGINCDNCLFANIKDGIFVGNADIDGDGLGDACDLVDNRTPADRGETPEDALTNEEGVVYVTSLKLNHNLAENRGTLENPYGYRSLRDLVLDESVREIRILGNGSIPTKLVMNHSINIVGGFKCAEGDFEEGFTCRDNYVVEIERRDEDGELNIADLPLLQNDVDSRIIIADSTYDILIKGFRIVGAAGIEGASLTFHSGNIILEDNFIKTNQNNRSPSSRSISINSQGHSTQVILRGNKIETGDLSLINCENIDRATHSSALAVLINFGQAVNSETNTSSNVIIENNKIFAGRGYNTSNALRIYGVYKTDTRSKIINNELSATCSLGNPINTISINGLPVDIENNKVSLKIKGNLPGINNVGTSRVISALQLSNATNTAPTHLKTKISNNLITINAERGVLHIGENDFVTGIYLIDNKADIYSNTIFINGTNEYLKAGITEKRQNSPAVANYHRTRIMSNIVAIEPAVDEVDRSFIPDELVAGWSFFDDANPDSAQDDPKAVVYLKLANAVVGLFSYNIAIGADLYTDLIRTTVSVPEYDIPNYQTQTNPDRTVDMVTESRNYYISTLNQALIHPNTLKPTAQNSFAVGKGYSFINVEEFAGQDILPALIGPTIDIDHNARQESSTAGCYEYMQNL